MEFIQIKKSDLLKARNKAKEISSESANYKRNIYKLYSKLLQEKTGNGNVFVANNGNDFFVWYGSDEINQLSVKHTDVVELIEQKSGFTREEFEEIKNLNLPCIMGNGDYVYDIDGKTEKVHSYGDAGNISMNAGHPAYSRKGVMITQLSKIIGQLEIIED
jgi:hypothetical protein